jgi:hypothetical protein
MSTVSAGQAPVLPEPPGPAGLAPRPVSATALVIVSTGTSSRRLTS